MIVAFWILCVVLTLIDAQKCSNCVIGKTIRMKSADCSDKSIEKFPQCLPSDVEIIGLSSNRIRRISRYDLDKYSSLQYLYLNDNFFEIIEDKVFENCDYLHTLDLSYSGLTKVPLEVFHLPSLTNLYLGRNVNMNIDDAVEKTKPISSPIKHLDISFYATEEPKHLPNLGILPQLLKYNISGNTILDLSTKHFAGLCNLRIFANNNVSAEFANQCDCWNINRLLERRKVKFTLFDCDIASNACPDEVPQEEIDLYCKCVQEMETIIRTARLKKIGIYAGSIAGALLLIILIAGYAEFRRRQRRKQVNKNKSELEGHHQLMNNQNIYS